MQDCGETNSQDQHLGKILFPHQQIHTTTSLSYFTDTETPSQVGEIMVCCPQAYTPQTS